MVSSIEKVEEFFGKQFEPPYSTPGEIREFRCFDGYAHWNVWLDEEKEWFYFTANKEPIGTFPLLEIGVFCSSARIASLTGGCSTLTLQPKGESHNLVGITKTDEGRFSICTNVGEMPVLEEQISIESGNRISRDEVTLDELLEGCTAGNKHGEIDSGAAIGREA